MAEGLNDVYDEGLVVMEPATHQEFLWICMRVRKPLWQPDGAYRSTPGQLYADPGWLGLRFGMLATLGLRFAFPFHARGEVSF